MNIVQHGVAHEIKQCTDNESLFNNLPEKFMVGRYHSWVVNNKLPDCLVATSYDSDGKIMSLRHTIFDIKGVQFHPESILTPNGKQILKNWIST